MEFCIAKHVMTGQDMVEVWRDGKFIASIYPHEEGIKIISKHLDGVEHEVNIPPSLIVRFSK